MTKRATKKQLTDTVKTTLDTRSTGKLAKIQPETRRHTVASTDEARAELRRLVDEHQASTRRSVAIASMVADRTVREDRERPDGSVLKKGTVIKANVSEALRLESQELSTAFKKEAAHLESAMLRELKKLPLYTMFLAPVFGCGAVVSAYLIAFCDFHKAVKVSNLRRFCGLAVINGVLERRTKGVKLGYCSELRVRLYQMFGSMWKNAAKRTKDAPHGVSTKYLDVWRGYKTRIANSARIENGKIQRLRVVDDVLVTFDKATSAKAFAHSTGWHKAADVFVEDLYIIGRTLEGLPVWPSYHAAKLGYSHGGKICVDAPRMLTIEEALETVGFVGARPLAAAEAMPVVEEDGEEIAAE